MSPWLPRLCVLVLLSVPASCEGQEARWTPERANEWYNKQPWLVGCNFIPSTAINQLPGAGDIPVLGALFRSTAYSRNETELVISVTPYLVDPVKGTDIKLPVDDYRPASFMESIFFGALGSDGFHFRLRLLD